MAKTSLPPGFRFHPTDIELVKYYLKRKIMQKKLPREVIAELDIYKYAPWDLPEKSSLRSRDLKWYFFCPREKKYSSGMRMNRSTEFGYWKTTGKDRTIVHNNEVSGQIKTLIFHRGRAPKGDRTDWVMHEYRLEDTDVTVRGFSQDAYVICMIFQKDGPGPRNGAQYGAPFDEWEWDDGDEDENVNSVEPSPSTGLPTRHPVNISNDLNNAHDMVSLSVKHFGTLNDSCISEIEPYVSNEATLVRADEISPSEQIPNDLNDYDDVSMMLNQFTENDNCIPNETEVGNPPTRGNADSEPVLVEDNFFNGLGDLDNLSPTILSNNNVPVFNDSRECGTSSNMYPFEDGSYLEMIDLINPIDYAAHGGELFMTDLSILHATSSGVDPLFNPNESTLDELQSFNHQMDNYLSNPATSGQEFHGVGHSSPQPANLYGFDCFMDMVNEENMAECGGIPCLSRDIHGLSSTNTRSKF